MKRVIWFLVFAFSVCMISDAEEVKASEEKVGIYIETEGNDNFESAKTVIRSEIVMDVTPTDNGMMLLND